MAAISAALCLAALAKPATVVSPTGRTPVHYAIYALPASLTNQLAAAAARPVCERAVVEGGAIVETWREGARTWTVTNTPAPVVGSRLKSTFSERLAAIEEQRDYWREAWTNASVLAEANARRAERAEARYAATTNKLQEAIDDAKLPTTKLLLQAILEGVTAAAGGGD